MRNGTREGWISDPAPRGGHKSTGFSAFKWPELQSIRELGSGENQTKQCLRHLEQVGLKSLSRYKQLINSLWRVCGFKQCSAALIHSNYFLNWRKCGSQSAAQGCAAQLMLMGNIKLQGTHQGWAASVPLGLTRDVSSQALPHRQKETVGWSWPLYCPEPFRGPESSKHDGPQISGTHFGCEFQPQSWYRRQKSYFIAKLRSPSLFSAWLSCKERPQHLLSQALGL